MTQLVHVSNLYYNVRQIELAELLGQLSGGMRSFFSNSGAEANEGAIKLARKFGRMHCDGAYEVISMERSFHGRTLATTAATGQAFYQATWVPLPDGFKQVPYNDLEALQAAVSEARDVLRAFGRFARSSAECGIPGTGAENGEHAHPRGCWRRSYREVASSEALLRPRPAVRRPPRRPN